jgi:ParB-like chromosome segregation protein Spo0J
MKSEVKLEMPVNLVKWVDRNELKPNDYNPNAVAPPELRLLKISILEDGWTQPIVCNEDNTIVDGFHRWTVAGSKEIAKLTGGKVPVVYVKLKDAAHKKMSTIRHNRARGTHAVLKMADIVESMIAEKLSMEEICERLQMESEEVVRLANRKGIPNTEIVRDANWSNSWVPK